MARVACAAQCGSRPQMPTVSRRSRRREMARYAPQCRRRDVRRRNAPVVSVGGNLAAVRSDRYPRHIRTPVPKWGFVLLTAYTGVFRLSSMRSVAANRSPGCMNVTSQRAGGQTLGSTMHCVAGDGVGILAGAVLAGILGLTGAAEVILEYVLGFAFGWMTFQALFMREMAGGLLFPLTYQRLHSGAALDEPVYGRNGADGDGVAEGHCLRGRSHDRRLLVRKSIGVMVGFMIPHPMNWWVVTNHLKHGMKTVRPAGMPAQRRIRMQRPARATRRTSRIKQPWSPSRYGDY